MTIMDQNETPLFNAIKKHVENKVTPFHVPGHKQGRGIPEFSDYVGNKVMSMDVNGMEGLIT